MRSQRTSTSLVAFCALLFLGDGPVQDITLLRSIAVGSTAYDQGDLLLVSVQKDAGSELIVGRQWMKEIQIPLGTKAQREGFAKEFYRLVPQKTTLELVSVSFLFFAGYTKPESLQYRYADTLTLRSFWQRKEFAGILQSVQNPEISEVVLMLRGWSDTTVTTTFDDPAADSRALHKVHLRLLPGFNRIYLSTPARRSTPLEYVVTSVAESNPIDQRPSRFHGSDEEAACVACHEGTPSSSPASSDKCVTCHRALTGGLWKHSPAEMAQCETCHEWSAEKKAVIVGKGVPGSCVECHLEKGAIADSATVVHPVTDDCTACHSPHSADTRHLLKRNVFDLCTACHEKYAMNHPVGRHPVRFTKLAETGAEISCVSCHNPHGNNNKALLKSGSGPMEICLDCHTR